MFAPTTLFALLSALTAVPALAAHNQPRRAHHPVLADYEARRLRELEERLLPITATTTVYVEETHTQTVWVQPTDQVHYEPSVTSGVATETSASVSSSAAVSTSKASQSAASVSVSSAPSTSSSVYPSSASSTSDTQSSVTGAQASSTAEASSSMESSASTELGASTSSHRSASASGSNAPSPSKASGSGPARSSPVPTASGSDTSSDATSLAQSTSDVSSVSDDPSASVTSSSKSASNAPTLSRSSGSGAPRPTPTPSSSYHSESSSATKTSSVGESASSESSSATATSMVGESASSESSSATATSLVVESASSSSSDPRETLWSASSSAVIASVTASASANASSSYSSLGISSSSAIAWSASASDSSASASASVTASPTSSASVSSSTLVPLGSRLMNGYFPDWAAYYLPPESVDWSKYDVMEFAFALPTQDGGLQFTQDDSSDLLHRLVASGHAAGKRVKLSIGGWTGSAYFSTICADDWLRATFVKNIVKAYKAYNIDGIDIDWEYPGTSGAAGNAVSSDDSANYLKLLQDMRAALPADALITAATQVWPFAGPDGNPLSDVSAFAEVLDWILIMNYDIWGSSSTPGPNAPLSDACGNSTQPLANAYAAVSSWTTAGMPANKITLGVPAYGYLSGSWANSLVQRRSHFPQPPHKRAAAAARLHARDDVTVNNGNGGTTDGQVMFYSLLQQGALTSDGQGGYTGAGGFIRHWDSCSSTPWLKSDASGQIITYDDTESMSLKGQFAAQAGIRGCNVFSVDGDYTNPGFPLTDAVRSGLGL